MVPGLIESKTLEDLERESGIALPPCHAGKIADVMAEALASFVDDAWTFDGTDATAWER